MVIKPPTKKTKNPPIFSHEFVIQNHGDIVSGVAMIIVIGLLTQATAAIASAFVIPQHIIEETVEQQTPGSVVLYTNGIQDIATVFFYCLITIVVHAIAQDYLLDRLNRKLHLSKLKNSKFNESGQLLLFAVFAAMWGMHVIVKDETITSLSSLWSNYPEDHVRLTFRMKFYFIIQIAYWLHSYPELYFQKVKRDEILGRIMYATLHLILVTAAYTANMGRLALVLLILHYIGESVLHASRLLHYAELTKYACKGFKAYNVLFLVFRLVSLILAIMTVQFGLGAQAGQVLDIPTGNYNTPLLRMCGLGAVCAVQAWMMYSFITFHLSKRRQRRSQAVAAQKKRTQQQQQAKALRKSKRLSDEDEALLPEVDQNTRRRR